LGFELRPGIAITTPGQRVGPDPAQVLQGLPQRGNQQAPVGQRVVDAQHELFVLTGRSRQRHGHPVVDFAAHEPVQPFEVVGDPAGLMDEHPRTRVALAARTEVDPQLRAAIAEIVGHRVLAHRRSTPLVPATTPTPQ
jgi:hypothetical protein